MISRLLDKHPQDDQVQGQLNEILEALSLESKSSEPSWSEVFSNSTKSRNLHRVFLGMGPYMMNQWSGVNVSVFVCLGREWNKTHPYCQALCYYLAFILQEYLGYSPSLSLILASVAFTQYALFSCAPYFYIDRIGRRKSIMGSSAGCGICMAVIAGCLAAQTYAAAAAAVAFMFIFLDCFTFGIMPVSWSYSAEIQPLNVRNKATVSPPTL